MGETKLQSIEVPDGIRDFLVIEDCSGFPLERYVLTQNEAQIARDINNARKIAPQMKEMNIAYLNSTLLYGEPGTGKAQPLTSKVLTPLGYKEMGKVEIGDTVMTPDGTRAKVMAIYPQGVKDIYKITMSDGATCRCSVDHLWEVTTPDDRLRCKDTGRRYSKVMTLADMIKTIKETDEGEGYFGIPALKPYEGDVTGFAISPEEYGKSLAEGRADGDEMYFAGSIKHREELLEAFKKNSSSRIRDGDREIIKSPGKAATDFIKDIAWSVGVGSEESDEGLIFSPAGEERFIKKIEPVGREECQCIYINDPRHLYITDGMIATHNTTFGRYMAFKLKMPFAYIQFANIMSGSMGETSRNITRIFDFIKDKRCIFMMDEIDAISARRGDVADKGSGGELGRITITVMQELDKLKRNNSSLIIIAASNVIKGIDDALRSRFAIRKRMVRWTNAEKEMYIKKYLDSIGIEHTDEMVHTYITQNSSQEQRGIEADINRCIADWLLNGKKEFKLNHIREMEVR